MRISRRVRFLLISLFYPANERKRGERERLETAVVNPSKTKMDDIPPLYRGSEFATPL